MLGNSFLCHCFTIVLFMTNGAYSNYRQLKVDEILTQKKNTFLTVMRQRGRIYAYECNEFPLHCCHLQVHHMILESALQLY